MSQSAARIVGVLGDQTNMTSATEIELGKTPLEMSNNSPSFSQLNEVIVANTSEHQIVPGITVTPAGQATVALALTEVLFDLAIKLEDSALVEVLVGHVKTVFEQFDGKVGRED